MLACFVESRALRHVRHKLTCAQIHWWFVYLSARKPQIFPQTGEHGGHPAAAQAAMQPLLAMLREFAGTCKGARG